MFSKFFIQRPIFALVMAIFMVMAGALVYKSLPVAQYPDISPPTVMVSANYPGADAATVAQTVGEPLEEQINGVEGMMYMSSNSADGQYSLTITFENGVDIDDATVKVQNRVSQVQATLPEAVVQQGVSVNSQSSNILMFVALEADSAYNYDALYLSNYAQLHITEALSRVDGVGDVGVFGGGEYSMRVWLDPQKMQAMGISPSEVIAAIEAQNKEISAGTIGAPPQQGDVQFEFTLSSKGMLEDAASFGNIVIRINEEGGMLRLKDVGRVELGSDSYGNVARVNGNQTAMIAISQRSGANALKVAKGVGEELKNLEKYFPEGVKANVLMDTTQYITASIDDLMVTFIETTLIVMFVILLFLQNWRAVIIPMLTIPVSLIATLAVMKVMGFSLNTLTLFGMVLAIAIVVDDAIVVVEDVARLLEEGKLNQVQASEKAMQELQGPIVGEVLVLLSVFIPTAFISGITGELYKQFALTIAVSTAFSGFNALTFTPAMCALFLRKKKAWNFAPIQWFNKGWAATLSVYMKIVGKFLQRPWVAIGMYFAVCIAAFWGFSAMPTSYIPEEDMGYFMSSIQLPTGASLDRTDAVTTEIAKAIKQLPEVDDVISVSGHSFMGGSGSNMAGVFTILKPWKERKKKSQHIDEVIAKVNEITSKYEEPIVFSLNPPAIPGLGMTSGLQMQLLDINNLGSSQLMDAISAIKSGAEKDDRIASVTSLYEGTVPQYSLRIDRNKAELHDIDINNLFATVSSYIGGSYVNDFEKFGRMYQVNLMSDGSGRTHPDQVLQLTVANKNGEMVPFGAFAEVVPTQGESQVSRYNMYTTASLTATPAKGVSTSQAIEAMENIVSQQLGDNFSYAWTGEAYQETQAGTTISLVLILAVIITFLVLAAQYGSWTDPMAVIISMPTAILGTVIGCIFMGQSISIYTQIGIILLLGMSAKNAILIVEYAMDFRKGGQPIRQAALDAGRIRFRPIMMTALAFVFGVMPMLFASGAGAGSQKALGAAVVFGMAINAFVGTLFVPNFWELLEKFGEKYLTKFFGAGKESTTLDDDEFKSV